MFEPDIPDNFVKLDVKFTRPSEESLLNALNRIRELTGGRYTSSLQVLSVVPELAQLVAERATADPLGGDEQAMLQVALEVASGCKYYMSLVSGGYEPEYFGDTVTEDDADQVLLRWHLDDGSTRVIYGDLRVETVSTGESAK